MRARAERVEKERECESKREERGREESVRARE